jgi:glycosyltransferase involved in cell wall biosynthesis
MLKKIYINGRFLTQPITGVQRYGHEIVSAFDRLLINGKIDPEKYLFILLTPSKNVLFNPGYQKIQKKATGKFSGHLWEQLELSKYSSDGLLFCPGNTAPISSLKGDQKVIVTIHDLSYQYFPEAYSLPFKIWYHFLIPKIFARAEAIITVSNSEKNSLIKYFQKAESRIYVVQNGGLPEDTFKRISVNINKNQKNSILYVGALSRRKNIDGLISAFELVCQEKDIQLSIVGASGQSFQRLKKKSHVNCRDRIKFWGQINDPETLVKLYQKNIGLIFPSFYEASPLPPIEAMACGCPVIASNIPSLQERCGDAAIYCDPYNVQNIAKSILNLFENVELRNEIIEKGRKRAEKYNWITSALETFQIIENVI